MNAYLLLEELRHNGVLFSVLDGKLVVDAPIGLITSEQREYLAIHKTALVKVLRDQEAQILPPTRSTGELLKDAGAHKSQNMQNSSTIAGDEAEAEYIDIKPFRAEMTKRLEPY